MKTYYILLVVLAVAGVGCCTSLVESTIGGPLDISWMTDSQKKVLENAITWYKLKLTEAKNILNPAYWNLDFVLPAVSSVITLYTGPIVGLAIILFFFGTIPALASSLFTNISVGRSLDVSMLSPTVDALWTAVSRALDRPPQ